jgi:hypothetical protein
MAWLLLVMVLGRMGDSVEKAPPPAADSSTSAPAEAPRSQQGEPNRDDNADDSDTDVVGYLVPPMLALMVLVVIGTAVASRRQRRGPDHGLVGDDDSGGTPAPAAADSLARAAEVGLAEIADLTREPREAIIACYAAMEDELMRVPGAVPQAFDTPTEVLARAVDRHALRADSATELVELFEEARFSGHVMTETHRDSAVRVLERVLAELPRSAARRSA